MIILFLAAQIYLNITNPDFENWVDSTTPEGWMVMHPLSLPVYKEPDTNFSGIYSIKVVRASKTTSNTEALSQWITVDYPGMEYKFTGYIFDNDPDVYGRITVSWYQIQGVDTVYLSAYARSSPSYNQNTWQELSVSDAAPDTADLVKLSLRIYRDANSSDSLGHTFYDLITGLEIKEKSEITKANPALDIKKGTYDISGRKNKKGRILFIRKEKTKKIIRIK